jgi:TrmH family RNA methyltransferase
VFALVIGNEANGVSNETLSRATHAVKIPMRDTQESLNAAVSAGILMYLLKKNDFSTL